MEFIDFMELVIPMVRNRTNDQFDIHLSWWLKDGEAVPLEKRYTKWKEEPVNLPVPFDDRLHHLLMMWQDKVGQSINPQSFFDVINRRNRGAALLVDKLKQQ